MAYGTRYRTTVRPLKDSTNVKTIDFMQKDYVGSITTLKTKATSCILNVDEFSYFDPIASSNLELEIINNLMDFWELEDLFAVSDFEWYVKMYDDNYTYFEGFIPCELTEMKYYAFGEAQVLATNNLKRLSDFEPTLFNVRGYYPFIEIVQHILAKTGLALPIYVNCSLKCTDSAIDTILDLWVYSDIFLSNDEEYKDCRDILENILSSFNCVLYYWNGAWYIERYKDLADVTRSYVVYEYSSSDTHTVSVTLPTINVVSGETETGLKYTDLTQVIGFNPGFREVKLNLQEKTKKNLIPYRYDNLINVTNIDPEIVDPVLDTFEKLPTLETATYTNWHKMQRVFRYHNTQTPTVGVNYDLYSIPSDRNSPEYLAMLKMAHAGLYSKFVFTTNTDADTNITVKFKYRVPEFIANAETGIWKAVKDDLLVHPDKYLFFFRIYLREAGTSNFVRKNASTGKYYLESRTGISTFYEFIVEGQAEPYIPGVYLIDPCYIEQKLSFSSFDKYTMTCDVSFDISIDDFKDDLTTNCFIIGVHEAGYSFADNSTTLPTNFINRMDIGDLMVSVNSNEEDNVIIGHISDDFVTKYDKDQLFYDSKTMNILNGLLYLPDPKNRTTLWTDSDNITTLPLTKKIIEDYAQIYHLVRRQISADVMTFGPVLYPTALVTDSHFTNKYICAGYRWNIEASLYEGCLLKEIIGDDGQS